MISRKLNMPVTTDLVKSDDKIYTLYDVLYDNHSLITNCKSYNHSAQV